MNSKIYPIGVQNFEEISVMTIIFILIKRHWFIN